MAEVKVQVSLAGPVTKEHFDKKNPVFRVSATYRGQSWFVLHPWSDFVALQQHLRPDGNGGGGGNVPRLPSAKAGLFKQPDVKFWEKRTEQLGAFMHALLGNVRTSQNPTVREFIKLDLKVAEISSSARSGESGFESADLAGALDDTQSTDADRVDIGPTERINARPSDFDYMKCIGRGSFGKVYMAVHKREKKVYAVKVLAKAHIKKRNEVRHIMSERNVLVVNIKHPFLVGLHYSFQTRDKLYFVLEYLNGGELFFHLQREKRFPEARARFYAAEIASALGYLHSKDIIYRDLKPENLLIDATGHVVITDFGLCKENVRGRQTTSTFCGTPEYLAPEVVLKQPYDRTVDWWCLGSVLYEMLFGLPPFYSKDHKEMYDRIVNMPLRVPAVAAPPVKDLLQQMLQKDRNKRMGARKDFDEVKAHVFFAVIDWGLLEQRKVTPPYIPKVADNRDTTFVDKEFLSEPISESVGKNYQDLSQSMRAREPEFTGFTYVSRMELDEIAE